MDRLRNFNKGQFDRRPRIHSRETTQRQLGRTQRQPELTQRLGGPVLRTREVEKLKKRLA